MGTCASTAPLLDAPWILDIDTTIKPLYGQEGAVVSYNPHKPGRPSHSYHTYLMAGLRLVMGVEIKAGNEHSGSHTLPGLLKILMSCPPSADRRWCAGIVASARRNHARARSTGAAHAPGHIERLFRVSGWTEGLGRHGQHAGADRLGGQAAWWCCAAPAG